MLSCTEVMKNYRTIEWFELLKAQPNLLLKGWRKTKGSFFSLFIFISFKFREKKMTLLLKKLFLMNTSMKNGKKPEMQQPASGQMLRGWLCHGLSATQPLVEGTKGTTMTGQGKARKKKDQKKAHKTQARRQGNNLFPGPRKTLKKKNNKGEEINLLISSG